MKKITWLLCALLLCSVVATGCGGGDKKETKKKAPVKKPA